MLSLITSTRVLADLFSVLASGVQLRGVERIEGVVYLALSGAYSKLYTNYVGGRDFGSNNVGLTVKVFMLMATDAS